MKGSTGSFFTQAEVAHVGGRIVIGPEPIMRSVKAPIATQPDAFDGCKNVTQLELYGDDMRNGVLRRVK